jgi:hypothetical protein
LHGASTTFACIIRGRLTREGVQANPANAGSVPSTASPRDGWDAQALGVLHLPHFATAGAFPQLRTGQNDFLPMLSI